MKRDKVVKQLERLALNIDVIAEINESHGYPDVASGYADSARMVRREAQKIKEKM